MNMSLGGYAPALNAAAAAAVEEGMVVVCAAGNDGVSLYLTSVLDSTY